MAKNRKNKKYNPNHSQSNLKEEWLRSLWLSDSSLHREVVLHNHNRIRGRKIQPPKALMTTWADAIHETPYNWRFAFYGFDAENEEIYPSIFSSEKRITSIEMCDLIREKVTGFLFDSKDKIDSWGWAAVPSLDVDMDKMEDFFIEYFQMIGLADPEKIVTRKQYFLANPQSTHADYHHDILGIE